MQFKLPFLLLGLALSAQAAPVATAAEGESAIGIGGHFAKAGTSITFSIDGGTKAGANLNKCAHVGKKGLHNQLVCVIAETDTGFSMRVTDEGSKAKTVCKIAGLSGTCGPAKVNAVLVA